MASLATKTKKLNGIVSIKGYSPDLTKETCDKFKEFLSKTCDIYAFIVHDRDITEDGTPKTLHIHFVADLKVACRLSTSINNISAALYVDPFAITIDKYTSFEGSIQYLVHKNNPEKHQYQTDSIITNISHEDLLNYLDSNTIGFDLDKWIVVIGEAQTLTDVIKAIGVSYYNMYRNTICDLFRQFHGGELYGYFPRSKKDVETDF